MSYNQFLRGVRWIPVFVSLASATMFSWGAEEIWKKSVRGGNVDSSPICTDLDGDGVKELVMTTTGGEVLVWTLDGEPRIQTGIGEAITISPAAGDLVEGAGKEICAITQNGLLVCLDANGRRLWEYRFPGNIEWGKTAIVLDDVDLDGSMEVLTGDSTGRFVCLSGLGDEIWRYEVPGGFHCPPATADLNGKPGREILLTSGAGALLCLDSGGALLWETEIGCDNSSGPVVTDLEGDGVPDILLGGADGKLKRISSTGKIVWELQATNEIDATIAAADVNGDGRKEIFCMDLYGAAILCNADGEELWRYSIGARSRRPPTIADFDRDGDIEILVANYTPYLYLFSARGEIEDKVTTRESINGVPLVVDIDGRLAAICVLAYGDVLAYTWMPAPGGADAPPAVLWGEYRADEGNSGDSIGRSSDSGVVLKDISYGRLATGSNQFSLNLENPREKELSVSLHIHKDASSKSAQIAVRSSARDVHAEMQYALGGTAPETLAFSYSVTDADGGLLLSGRKRFYVEPFEARFRDRAPGGRAASRRRAGFAGKIWSEKRSDFQVFGLVRFETDGLGGARQEQRFAPGRRQPRARGRIGRIGRPN